MRQVRHDLHGRLNAIKLCVIALPTCDSPTEYAEFLATIEQEADRLIACLDKYEALYDAQMRGC